MQRPCWTYAWWWRNLFWHRRQEEYERHLYVRAQMLTLERRLDKQRREIKELEETLMRHITQPTLRPFEWDTKR